MGATAGSVDAPMLRVYCATPHLGHGLNAETLQTALELGVDVVVAQGTSTDPGPFYLGVGRSYMHPIEVKKDMTALLTACRRHRVPFIVSTGGPGDNSSLEVVLDAVDEIAHERELNLDVAVVRGEIDKEWLRQRLRSGALAKRIVPTPALQEQLDETLVDHADRIVAQLGPEPIMRALTPDVHGVITGRALDVGLFAAVPLQRGFPTAIAMHFATVMHDGALAAVPGSGSDGIYGVLEEDAFTISSPNPARRCTTVSIAGMSFYERPNPFEETMPSGVLDVSSAIYEALDDGCVRVSGARWRDRPYTIKLEGAALQGFRTICLGGACEPRFIEVLDDVLEHVSAEVAAMFAEHPGDSWQLDFKVYGRDAVLQRSLDTVAAPREVGILIDVLAETQALASAICSVTRSALMHHAYPGRKTTAGNLAVPFSPVEIDVGPSYRYSIWHALELDDPVEPFPAERERFPRVP